MSLGCRKEQRGPVAVYGSVRIIPSGLSPWRRDEWSWFAVDGAAPGWAAFVDALSWNFPAVDIPRPGTTKYSWVQVALLDGSSAVVGGFNGSWLRWNLVINPAALKRMGMGISTGLELASDESAPGIPPVTMRGLRDWAADAGIPQERVDVLDTCMVHGDAAAGVELVLRTLGLWGEGTIPYDRAPRRPRGQAVTGARAPEQIRLDPGPAAGHDRHGAPIDAEGLRCGPAPRSPLFTAPQGRTSLLKHAEEGNRDPLSGFHVGFTLPNHVVRERAADWTELVYESLFRPVINFAGPRLCLMDGIHNCNYHPEPLEFGMAVERASGSIGTLLPDPRGWATLIRRIRQGQCRGFLTAVRHVYFDLTPDRFRGDLEVWTQWNPDDVSHGRLLVTIDEPLATDSGITREALEELAETTTSMFNASPIDSLTWGVVP